MCFYPFSTWVIFNCMILTCDKRVYKTIHSHLEVSGVAGSLKFCPEKRCFLSFPLRSLGVRVASYTFQAPNLSVGLLHPCAKGWKEPATCWGWGSPASPSSSVSSASCPQVFGPRMMYGQGAWLAASWGHQDESRRPASTELAWFMVGSFQVYRDTPCGSSTGNLCPE